MKPQSILAIDVGSTKIACVIAQQALSDPRVVPGWNTTQPAWRIIGSGMAAYPPLMTGLGDSSLMARALTEALRETRVTDVPDRAIIGISHPQLGHATVTAQLSLADQPVTIRNRELTRVASCAVGQVLGIDREALLVESLGYAGNGFDHVMDPRGLVATGLIGLFHVVSIPLAMKRAIVQTLDQAGIELDRLVYNLKALAIGYDTTGTSSSRAASNSHVASSASRVLVVDIGGSCTDVAILEHGVIRKATTLAWGGVLLTEQLAKTCEVPWEQALMMSVEGLASQKPTVRQVVEAHLRVLSDALHTLLQQELMPDLVLATGRGAVMDGLVEWLETVTERPTELYRHPQAQALGELGRQLALTPSLGLIDLARQPAHTVLQQRNFVPASDHFMDRVIHATQRLLVEYF